MSCKTFTNRRRS